MTFDAANFDHPFTVLVSVNPLPPVDPGEVTVPFPAQAHVTASIQGPLIIDGGQVGAFTPTSGAKLPTELDTPLPHPGAPSNPSHDTDTVNVFDDGAVAGQVGTLDGITAGETDALDTIYGAAGLTVTPSEFGALSGLGMGPAVTLDLGSGGTHTFAGGLTYHDVEVLDVLLGSGNDPFTVRKTTPGAITVIQGGGGADHAHRPRRRWTDVAAAALRRHGP